MGPQLNKQQKKASKSLMYIFHRDIAISIWSVGTLQIYDFTEVLVGGTTLRAYARYFISENKLVFSKCFYLLYFKITLKFKCAILMLSKQTLSVRELNLLLKFSLMGWKLPQNWTSLCVFWAFLGGRQGRGWIVYFIGCFLKPGALQKLQWVEQFADLGHFTLANCLKVCKNICCRNIKTENPQSSKPERWS